MNAPAWLVATAATACLSVSVSVSAATVSDASTAWTALAGNYDYTADQQTGQPESDIVGSGTNHGFFTTFNNNGSASNTDGTLGFRLRLDAAGGNKNNPAFGRVAWIGLDGNGDAVLDAFIGLGMQGSSSTLGIYAPGNSANTSPNTTSISSTAYATFTIDSASYNYRPVNYATDGGTTNDVTTTTSDDTDYYVSFMVDFQKVVDFMRTQKNITITDQTALRYVLATSTQHNSLNQDLGGVNGGINSTSTWTQLGGFSQNVTASGNVVPEPSGMLLGAASLLLAAIRRKRD